MVGKLTPETVERLNNLRNRVIQVIPSFRARGQESIAVEALGNQAREITKILTDNRAEEPLD